MLILFVVLLLGFVHVFTVVQDLQIEQSGIALGLEICI
jgi:hypothetical protein